MARRQLTKPRQAMSARQVDRVEVMLRRMDRSITRAIGYLLRAQQQRVELLNSVRRSETR